MIRQGNTPNGSSARVPAPVGGWNAKSSLDTMRDVFAVSMVNVFPETTNVRLRRGFRVHTTGGMGGVAVQTLAEYAHEDGTRRLIACANGNIYNCTTYNSSATSLASGNSENRWQTVNFRNRLILVNGVDQPRQYDGSTISNATYTGIADDNKLVHVSVYKSRLYFCELNSASIWYGAVDAVTGALTEFDVSSLLKLGGRVEFAGAYSRDAGDANSDDLFVIVSNMGEILVYAGDNPGATNWALVGRYEMPVPLGRRAFINVGADMRIMTDQGIVSLGAVLGSNNSPAITDIVSDAWSDVVRSYGSNIGWEGLNYKFGHMGIFNVPTATNASAQQFVVNLLTGAWCCFKGIDSVCWGTLDKKPYFGGADGKVYEFDVGYNDNGSAIDIELKLAFNYFNDKQSIKHFTMCRPLFIGDASCTFLVGIDVDFEDDPIADTITITGTSGSPWDTSPWDTSPWDTSDVYHQDLIALTGIGKCGALKLKGSFLNAPFSISSFDVIFQKGGIFNG